MDSLLVSVPRIFAREPLPTFSTIPARILVDGDTVPIALMSAHERALTTNFTVGGMFSCFSGYLESRLVISCGLGGRGSRTTLGLATMEGTGGCKCRGSVSAATLAISDRSLLRLLRDLRTSWQRVLQKTRVKIELGEYIQTLGRF